jgi:hypothetical protein
MQINPLSLTPDDSSARDGLRKTAPWANKINCPHTHRDQFCNINNLRVDDSSKPLNNNNYDNNYNVFLYVAL